MRIIAISCLGLLLTACTQPAAQVVNKGATFYGPNGVASKFASNDSYNDNYSAPPSVISYGTSSTPTANITSVSSRDLGAPETTANASPFSTPSEVSHAPSNVSSRNLWESSTPKSSPTSSNFIKPVEGTVSIPYGKRANGMGNDGITYAAPLGEPVYASSSGEVAYVGDELKSYGKMVIIKHANNYNTAYSHLGRMVVSKGSKVTQGQIIGYVGQTGDAKEPALHFALRQGTNTVNPADFLPKQVASY